MSECSLRVESNPERRELFFLDWGRRSEGLGGTGGRGIRSASGPADWGWGVASWEHPDFRVWHSSRRCPRPSLCPSGGLGAPTSLPRRLAVIPSGLRALWAGALAGPWHLGSDPVARPHLCPTSRPGSWPAAGRWPACRLLGLTLPPTRPVWPRAITPQASVSSSVIGRRAKRTPSQISDYGSPDRDSRWVGVGPAGGPGLGGGLGGKRSGCFLWPATCSPWEGTSAFLSVS